MFTFSHITSIGLTKEEYAKRLAAGEKNLVKGENKWYREVATEITVPLTIEEIDLASRTEPFFANDEDVKLGEKKFTVPMVVKCLIVGYKLAVNQEVQQREKSGGVEWKSVLAKIIKTTNDHTERSNALNALIGKASAGKAFAEKWLEEHKSDAE